MSWECIKIKAQPPPTSSFFLTTPHGKLPLPCSTTSQVRNKASSTPFFLCFLIFLCTKLRTWDSTYMQFPTKMLNATSKAILSRVPSKTLEKPGENCYEKIPPPSFLPWAKRAWQHDLFQKYSSMLHVKTSIFWSNFQLPSAHTQLSIMQDLRGTAQVKAESTKSRALNKWSIIKSSLLSNTFFFFLINVLKSTWLLTLVWHKDSSLVSGCLSSMFSTSRLAPNITLSLFLNSHNFNSMRSSIPQQTDARGWGLISARIQPPGPLWGTITRKAEWVLGNGAPELPQPTSGS